MSQKIIEFSASWQATNVYSVINLMDNKSVHGWETFRFVVLLLQMWVQFFAKMFGGIFEEFTIFKILSLHFKVSVAVMGYVDKS